MKSIRATRGIYNLHQTTAPSRRSCVCAASRPSRTNTQRASESPRRPPPFKKNEMRNQTCGLDRQHAHLISQEASFSSVVPGQVVGSTFKKIVM